MKITTSILLIILSLCFGGCVHSLAFEDEHICVTKAESALFAHLDPHVAIAIKGTSFSFSGVDFGSRPYYLRVPGQNALLILTWTDHDYDLVFHVVDLEKKTSIDIPGGNLYFGQYYGGDVSKKGEASMIQEANASTMTLVSIGQTIAEGRYKEITVLDLKAAKVKSRNLIHMRPENEAKEPMANTSPAAAHQ